METKKLSEVLRGRTRQSLSRNEAYVKLLSDLNAKADDGHFYITIPSQQYGVNYLDFMPALSREGLTLSNTDKEISISW